VGDRLFIARRLVAARIRADWQYRTSFLLLTAGQAMALTMDLLAIAIVFRHVSSLAGWSFDEVLVLYGTAAVAFGLADLLISPVEKAALHIKEGSFDRFLLRPIGPMMHLCCDDFALRRVGKVLPPLVMLTLGLARVGINWTPAAAVVLAVTVVSGTAIFSAFFVMVSSLSFWTVDMEQLTNTVTYGGAFLSQYPLDVLTPWLRRLVVVIPLAFVNYLPMTWVLGRPGALGLPGWARFASPAVAAALAALAAVTWRTGIRHYRSTGS
jgi:ABC-2 type transport system permease protein